jgi:hypothetical protein
MLFRNTFKYLLPLLAALLVTSCIRDDRDDCRYPVSLRFLFTHNTQGTDLFDAEGIDNIHLFVYDNQNRLALEQQLHSSDLAPGNVHQLMLPMGRYTLIAWAGDLQETYSYESFQYLPDALIKLRRNFGGITDQPAGKLFNGICIPLFSGLADKDQYEADLSKNTNDIRITIKGKNTFIPRPEDFGCTISAVNGDYTFDNRTHGNDRVHYIPRTAGADCKVHCDFTVLRLWDGDASRLTLTYRPAGGTRAENIIYDGSLSKLLLKKPGTDLELEDHFELVFTVDNLDLPTDVTLTVNGWEVIDHNSGL